MGKKYPSFQKLMDFFSTGSYNFFEPVQQRFV